MHQAHYMVLVCFGWESERPFIIQGDSYHRRQTLSIWLNSLSLSLFSSSLRPFTPPPRSSCLPLLFFTLKSQEQRRRRSPWLLIFSFAAFYFLKSKSPSACVSLSLTHRKNNFIRRLRIRQKHEKREIHCRLDGKARGNLPSLSRDEEQEPATVFSDD